MINEIATIDVLDLAIDQLDEGRTIDCKDTLVTYRDKLQKEVDEFDKWAKAQSDIHSMIELENEMSGGK